MRWRSIGGCRQIEQLEAEEERIRRYKMSGDECGDEI
jgi:hypothetical protein